jgi:hypothetical protein
VAGAALEQIVRQIVDQHSLAFTSENQALLDRRQQLTPLAAAPLGADAVGPHLEHGGTPGGLGEHRVVVGDAFH